MVWDAISRSADETQRWGRLLGRLLKPGDWVLLEGPLGAGKTVFVQGIARGLGVVERVTSPTFTLVHHYGYADGEGYAHGEGETLPARSPAREGSALVHADLYRIGDPLEVEEIGLDEASDTAPVVVEWWRRAEEAFPPGRLEIRLERDGGASSDGQRRRMTCRATDARHQDILTAWRRAVERDLAEHEE